MDNSIIGDFSVLSPSQKRELERKRKEKEARETAEAIRKAEAARKAKEAATRAEEERTAAFWAERAQRKQEIEHQLSMIHADITSKTLRCVIIGLLLVALVIGGMCLIWDYAGPGFWPIIGNIGGPCAILFIIGGVISKCIEIKDDRKEDITSLKKRLQDYL